MHKFAAVIKQAALAGVLVLLISFFLSACTSDTEETLLSKPSISQSSGIDVPGEKWAMTDVFLRSRWDPTNVHCNRKNLDWMHS